MSIDEIVAAIYKMEWDDLVKLNEVYNNRIDLLTKLELQKYKMGDYVKVKDTKGNYHHAHVWKIIRNKVQVDLGNKNMANVNPHLLTRWTREGEVAEDDP